MGSALWGGGEGGSRSVTLPQSTASSSGIPQHRGDVAMSFVLSPREEQGWGCWFGGCQWGVLVWRVPMVGTGLGVPSVPCPSDPPPSHRRRAGDHAKDGDPGVDAAPHPGDAGELRGHGHAGGAAGQPPRRQPRPPPGQLQPQPLAQLQPQQPGHALAVTRARRAPGQSPARRHGTVGGPRASALAAAPRHGGRTPHSPGTPSLPERTPGGAPQPPAPPPSSGQSALVESHFRGVGALGRVPGDTPAPPAPAPTGSRPPSHPPPRPVLAVRRGGPGRTPHAEEAESFKREKKAKYIYINIYKYL